jgi:hypothetical protein
MTVLKQEVDEELDDFPIVLDGDQKGKNEPSIKSKVESINKQLSDYNLKKTALQDQAREPIA